MSETPVTQEPDLRAGRFVASLRRGRSLSPEQMAKLCGVSGSTIRDIEKRGTYPHEGTQDLIAAFFGLAKEQIWTEPRKPVSRKRTPSEKARMAVEAARADSEAQAALDTLTEAEAFAFGVAWAVIRGQIPFATPEAVTTRALLSLDDCHTARASA